MLLLSLPVSAEEPARLEIDRFPQLVSHGSRIEIVGHVDGATVSDPVALQRRFSHTDWSDIATAAPDESGRVSFGIDAPRYTGRYRLTIETAYSEPVVIRVRPELTLHPNRSDVMEGARVVVSGTLHPALPGRMVALALKVDGEWRTIDRLSAGDGSFRAGLRDLRSGYRPIRVTFWGDDLNSEARRRVLLAVHEPEPATWYGPGFFGNRTACGQRYHRDLLGVAHRTLPCGTMVSALYRGRSVRVPVVDRGPYGHANWDLTEETAQRLGFSGRDVIGVLRQRG